ncbi:MAG TPA: hypothetical protein VEY11_06295 [Pyrinomonadaceae bacterium]|nr:hypothetical protein [Pyrinomonadaceae bacterium]
MEQTYRVINEMKVNGVIDSYAVGGAIAAIFYIEPFTTYDLDVFCAFSAPGSGIITLTPIYDYLARLGYKPEKETINIEGWPVQFLPIFNALIDEAVERANTVNVGQTPVRVMRPEHLVAIMLDTGRAKDYARISCFLDLGAVNLDDLTDVLSRHNLGAKWDDYRRKFQ